MEGYVSIINVSVFLIIMVSFASIIKSIIPLMF